MEVADQPERIYHPGAQQLVQPVVKGVLAEQPVAIGRIERMSDLSS